MAWPKYFKRTYTATTELNAQSLVANLITPVDNQSTITCDLFRLMNGTGTYQGRPNTANFPLAAYYRYYKIKKATTRFIAQVQSRGGSSETPRYPYIHTWNDKFFDQGHVPTAPTGAYGTTDVQSIEQYSRLAAARKHSPYKATRTWLPAYIENASAYRVEVGVGEYNQLTPLNKPRRGWVPINYETVALDAKNPLFGLKQVQVEWGGLGFFIPGWEHMGPQKPEIGVAASAMTYTVITDFEVIFKDPIDYAYTGAPTLEALDANRNEV